jgi:RNA polymerase sigma-70 factor (ECF subfamily)
VSIPSATKARALPRAEPSSGVLVNALTFEQVYAEHARFVYRVLRGMGVPDAQADDALQDVFVVVHQRLHEFDARARVTSWLFQIALRVAYGYRRKTRRARDHTPTLELASAQSSPLEDVESSESARRLHALLDGLDDDKRAVLILADLEDMTAPEIADLTGVPLNTVYTRLRRARQALVALWNKRGGAR